MHKRSQIGKFVAEGVGTFCLVFAGTSAIVVNRLSNGAISHLGISLVFGLVVLAMIYAIGHISGAHMNPAVTLGFWSVGRVASSEIIPYLFAQLAGAFAASLTVAFLFGRTSANLGATIPVGSWQQSFVMEFILTFILMFVIMGVAHDDRAEGLMAGVAIGATIALEAVIGGPISGASMNPVRSIAPAVISGILTHQWIYCAAPVLGSICGAFAYRAVQRHKLENESKKGESMSKTKVLFVCIHNSARSQMAEALLKKVGGESFEAESAGLEPGKLNPLAVDAMKAIGIDISNNSTKRVFDIFKQGRIFHYVVTVCDETSAERCPIFPGITKRVHWSFEDPSSFHGTYEEKLAKTEVVRDQIEEKVAEFVQQINSGAKVGSHVG